MAQFCISWGFYRVRRRTIVYCEMTTRLIISKCYPVDFPLWLRARPQNPRFKAFLTLLDSMASSTVCLLHSAFTYDTRNICGCFQGVMVQFKRAMDKWPELENVGHLSKVFSNQTRTETMHNGSAYQLSRVRRRTIVYCEMTTRLIISKCYPVDFPLWLRARPQNPRFKA